MVTKTTSASIIFKKVPGGKKTMSTASMRLRRRSPYLGDADGGHDSGLILKSDRDTNQYPRIAWTT